MTLDIHLIGIIDDQLGLLMLLAAAEFRLPV